MSAMEWAVSQTPTERTSCGKYEHDTVLTVHYRLQRACMLVGCGASTSTDPDN